MKPISTTVVIPCVADHFRLLPKLLSAYSAGTVPPDQVVISLSARGQLGHTAGCESVPGHVPIALQPELVDQLLQEFPQLELSVLAHQGQLRSDQNRQSVTNFITGDLVLYNDCDDLPHPRRIEIIVELFRQHPWLMHLNHQWVSNDVPFEPIVQPVLTRIEPHMLDHNKPYGSGYGKVLASSVTVRREVLEKISWAASKWWDGDFEFCFACLNQYGGSAILEQSLSQYKFG